MHFSASILLALENQGLGGKLISVMNIGLLSITTQFVMMALEIIPEIGVYRYMNLHTLSTDPIWLFKCIGLYSGSDIYIKPLNDSQVIPGKYIALKRGLKKQIIGSLTKRKPYESNNSRLRSREKVYRSLYHCYHYCRDLVSEPCVNWVLEASNSEIFWP